MKVSKFVKEDEENKKDKGLIIYGIGAIAEIAHFYFSVDSKYKVVAFTVEYPYLKEQIFKGLKVIPFEEIQNYYSPNDYEMFIAIGYSKMNNIRTRFYYKAKEKGYKLASYISSYSVILTENIGDNCFILENNTIQPFTKIGNNVFIWSTNHIGHHVIIEDNCFIASNVTISGFCVIGKNSFIGIGANIIDNVKVSEYNLIGAGALITKNTKPYEVYKGCKALLANGNSLDYF